MTAKYIPEEAAMLPGAMALAVLCYVDLLTSIILINLGFAVERGPVMAAYYQAWGISGLVTGKILIVGLGFFAIETAWRTKRISRQSASVCYWIGTAAFCVIYVILFYAENSPLF